MANEQAPLTDAQIDAILRATGERLDLPPMADAAARARAQIELRSNWGREGQGRSVVVPFPTENVDAPASPALPVEPIGRERSARLRDFALMAAGLAAAAVLIVVLTLVFRGFNEDGTGDVASGPLAAETYEIPGFEFVGAFGEPMVPNEPVDVAVGPDGTLFVLDGGLGRVIAFAADGEIRTDWGDEGFSSPLPRYPTANALAVGPDGRVYVAADEVLIFDASGRQIASWPFPETANEETRYLRSHGLVVDSVGNVYVAGKSVIWKFESGTGSASTIEIDGGADFQLAIDSQDRLHIAGVAGSVLRVGPDGTTELLGQINNPGGIDISGFALAPDDSSVLFQSGTGGQESAGFIRLDSQGTEVARWPADQTRFFTGSLGPIWFGIAVTTDGTIVLPDPLAHRLALYSPDGTLVGEIQDERPDAFGRLYRIALDGDGNVLGYDPSLNSKVLRFAPDGDLLTAAPFESALLGEMESLFSASGFVATNDGGFVLAHQHQNRVFVYSPEGKLEQQWGQMVFDDPSGLQFPTAIALGPDGDLYLVDYSSDDNVKHFTIDGEFLGIVGTLRSEQVDIAYRHDSLWAVDGQSILRFSDEGGAPQIVATADREDSDGLLPGFPLTLALDADGNIYTFLIGPGPAPGTPTTLLAKLDPDGSLLWSTELRAGVDRYIDLAIGADGTLYLADSELRQILAYRPTGEPDTDMTEATATVELGPLDPLVVRRDEDADGRPQFGVYDPASGDLVDLPAGELVGISPDSGTLLLIEREPGEEWVRLEVIAVSTETFEELWRTDIGELAQLWPNTIYYDTVVAGDMVYVAIHDPDFRGEMLQIASIRLADGGFEGAAGLDTDVGELGQPEVEVDLLASLESTAPTILIKDSESGELLTLGREVRTDFNDLVLPAGTPHLLPGDDGFVIIPASGLATDPTIPYLMFDDMTTGTIALPFESVEVWGESVTEYALSSDGRTLYALSLTSLQVAVIDLERLEIASLVDLNDVPIDPLTGDTTWTSVSPLYARHPITVSPDGRYLYCLGYLRDHEGELSFTPPIWKIDTATWSVVDDWVPAAPWVTYSLFSNGDARQLYVSLGTITRTGDPGEGSVFTTENPGVAVLSGESLDDQTGYLDLGGYEAVGTLADFYREFHGRGPAVDGGASQ